MAKPAAPFVAPVSGSIIQQMAQVAAAINRKADAALGQPPTFHSIILVDPTGQSWEVSVDASGAISTTAVPR